MEMIIGGAYQGKRSFAATLYPDATWTDGAKCAADEVYSCRFIYHFESYIERMMREQRLPENFAEELIKRNPELIIITREIGYGVVPMDAFLRQYREEVGKTCTKLAAFSDKVYRVTLGIGVCIKE